MSYQPVNIDRLREQLIPVAQFRSVLEPTENLSEFEFATDGSAGEVLFNYPVGWQNGLDPDDGLSPTLVSVELPDGTARCLTQDAAIEAASLVGIQKSYTRATPGNMIQDHVNYWYNNGDKRLKLLAGPERAVAFTRGTIKPFSNNAILDSALAGIEAKFGNSEDVLVDYKYNHDLHNTAIRLILPGSRVIDSARNTGNDDLWSIGIDINNSVTGASPLELRGYLFSWWCTNGATTNHVSSGKYRRKPTLEVEDAYDWARVVVDDVLDGLATELDAVQALTSVSLGSADELNETFAQLMQQFRVPVSARQAVMTNLIESDDLTAYGLMNSLTAAANEGDLSANAVNDLLHAGGQIAHAMSGMCETCHRF